MLLRAFLLPRIVWFLYRLWSLTWRLQCHEPEGLTAAKRNGDKLVFAHWHGDELCIVPLIRPYRIATMTSTSKDGSLIDYAVRKFGGATSRGSSTRGGIGALKGLIRLMGQGYRASMAVDGPKGPLHRVKPGVFELSRLAGARIVPMGAACSHAFIFKRSWNKARLPKPFAKVQVQFLEPWPVIQKGDSAKSPELAERLAAEIAKACQLAANALP
ncbi:MAG: lysophospholipid acyltransferase family protein [Bdellovibrionales bacterium]